MTAPASSSAAPFDAIVIGTGFAGAVTACRLVEAGLRICVLERGRRYGPGDFPNYPSEHLFESQDPHAPPTDTAFPDFSRWLWSQDHGLYDVRDLKDTLSVQAAGYGGGSLIYANVHMRPPRAVFDAEWPAEYRGGTLDPYFDLAAYMLQAGPVPQRLAKSLRLQHAGQVIGAQGGTTSWFRTPLAVNFVGGRNPFGRDQQPCDMRARCWRGCDRQAKNTLDFNYLARAEDGTPAPDIRTLAEVTRIERGEDGRFTVFYRDLWRRPGNGDSEPAERFEHAPYVFLCAGSLNTTELLFRSRRLVPGKKAAKRLRVKLGSRYYPNADGLAAVFDCDEPHEADFGPTITSALLHARDASDDSCALEFNHGTLLAHAKATSKKKRARLFARGMLVRIGSATATLAATPMLDWGDWSRKTPAAGTLVLENLHGDFTSGDPVEIEGLASATVTARPAPRKHWFLIEDGGYPPDLEGIVGVFRSPLWLRRNRYFEPEIPPAPGASLRSPATRHLRVDALTEALGATSSRSFSSRGVIARSFSPDLSKATPTGTPAADFLPSWLATAAKDTRQEFFGYTTAMALPFLGRLLDEMSSSVARDIDPDTVKRLSRESINPRQLEVLVRGMLRQAIQILAGSEVEVAAKVARVLLQDVPGTLADVMRLAGDLLLWAVGYGSNDRRTGLLLIMGRDLYRGRLICEKVDGQRELRAQLPSPLLDSLSGVQERVLRDIARRAWNGELRTNPGWTTLGQRVTVHSQGGCPMGAPDTSVTAADGVVHGCPGLYVMDAAAFPVSVGVNPSATITAIAEFKIERFLTTEWSKRYPDTARWRAHDHADAAAWWSSRDRGELDPLNRPDLVTVDAPASGVVGLEFNEQMKGFFTIVDAARSPIDDVAPREALTQFIKAENDGIARGTIISLKLRATIRDLARLIATTADNDPAPIALSGAVVLDETAGVWNTQGATEPPSFEIDPETSFLQAFVRSPASVPTRFFRYQLVFHDPRGPRLFSGIKILRDDPGFDVWGDTSTLYFEIRNRDGGGPIQRGIARVSLDLFMREQLPSMTVTGTTDPIRQSWALAAYYKHFAGELAAVYGKRAQQFTDMLLKLVAGIHV